MAEETMAVEMMSEAPQTSATIVEVFFITCPVAYPMDGLVFKVAFVKFSRS